MATWKSLRTLLALALVAVLPASQSLAAALSITAANVAYIDGPKDGDQAAGEAFIAGAVIYLAAAGIWLKAQDDGTAIEACSLGCGVALFTADAVGARGSVARPGATISIGTGTAGTVYALCDTAGSICPVADGGTTDKMTVIAVGMGSNKLQLGYIYNAGSVVP